MRATNTTILLTACIFPNGMAYTKLQDSAIREQQYLDALLYYLNNSKYRIVFVENTATDISNRFIQHIQEGRLEYITFRGNDYNHERGKGYGEAQIIQHAMQNSKFIRETEFIIKITGRLIVKNIYSLCFINELSDKRRKKKTVIACHFRPKKKIANSVFFIARKDFLQNYFLPNIMIINDSKNIWFEHVLYNAILAAQKDRYEASVFYIPAKIEGMSGTSCNIYPKVTFIDYFKSFGAAVLHNLLGIKKF